MKKLFLFAIALFTMSIASAQINTVKIDTRGDVLLRQGPQFSVTSDDGKAQWNTQDSVLYLYGNSDYEVTVEVLGYLEFYAKGDVNTEGTLRADKLVVLSSGSGDVNLNLDYDWVLVKHSGRGDVILQGHSDELQIVNVGSGDVINHMDKETHVASKLEGLSDLMAELGRNLEQLADSVDWDQFERDMERWGESMEEWGRHMEEWGEDFERRMEGRAPRDRKDRHEDWNKPHYGPQPKDMPAGHFPGQRPSNEAPKSLLFDPHWGGFDAGLNMLLSPGTALAPEGEYAFLDLRPLKSWNFNFNIADVGIAFNRNHVAGLYTGIGLGWNNYSFNNPIRLVKGDQHLEADWVDESVEGRVKKSKLGVLYVQMPLMIEVRPTRGFFIAAGVTGGLRIDTWSKIKFMDRYKEKVRSDYYVNPLKLDATLRAGGNDMGFFASYNLLPLFRQAGGPDAHTFNVGFSLLF